jgi:aspartate/methionine/tyrosine aminotransferase
MVREKNASDLTALKSPRLARAWLAPLAIALVSSFATMNAAALDDVTFAKWMCEEIGVATVPGSSFYSDRSLGKSLVRFAFCKKYETLKRAADRLVTVRTAV